MKKLKNWIRQRALRAVNLRRLAETAGRLAKDERIPVFVIASPPDMHLAPLAVANASPEFRPVIIGNGLPAKDLEWLRHEASGVPVVGLCASFSSNSKTYLPHAEVVRLCALVTRGHFIIQDADCFVLDQDWWRSLTLPAGKCYASGPFGKPMRNLEAMMPDTFLVAINGPSYRERESRGIRPDIAPEPPRALRPLLQSKGFPPDYYPDTAKSYYDTLQAHWTAATLNGDAFDLIPGGDRDVVHVGGSSYLNDKPVSDVTHWDYWPLNTAYFHMRILDSPRFAPVRSRLAGVYARYGSAAQLLQDHPGFLESGRYRLSERMLEHLRPYLGQA